MIASPGDVNVERAIVREIVHEWNAIHSEKTKMALMPLGWELNTAPVTGDRGQAVVNSQILERSDLLVAMFWTRIGTPTTEAVSGTAEEIQEHIAAGKPAMIYFSNAPVRPDSVDEDQYRSVQEFRKWCQEKGLIETYDSQEEFREKFRRQLATIINSHEAFEAEIHLQDEYEGSGAGQLPKLSDEARHLVIEAARSNDGIVGKIAYMGGAVIQANGKNFAEEGNPRSRAIWEGAINELVDYGLLEPVGHKDEIFRITRRGYEVADLLESKS